MGHDSIVNHSGRGDHLVEEYPNDDLDKGCPAKASLHVFMQEPLPPEHPFRENGNIMLTLRVAESAVVRAIVQHVADGMSQFQKGGKPLGLINRIYGY